jgi:hypothetical protein
MARSCDQLSTHVRIDTVRRRHARIKAAPTLRGNLAQRT